MRPLRIAHRRLALLGLAALHVRGHRDVHQLRVRQPEVLHVPDEVALADVAAEARIEAALFATLVTVRPR
jgi:hypothetical protein